MVRPTDASSDKKAAEVTNRTIAFRAFKPDLQLTNNEVHAKLNRGTLQAWATPNDLLIELKKSYPDCRFDISNLPTKVIFISQSGRDFYLDFEEQQQRTKPTQIG